MSPKQAPMGKFKILKRNPRKQKSAPAPESKSAPPPTLPATIARKSFAAVAKSGLAPPSPPPARAPKVAIGPVSKATGSSSSALAAPPAASTNGTSTPESAVIKSTNESTHPVAATPVAASVSKTIEESTPPSAGEPAATTNDTSTAPSARASKKTNTTSTLTPTRSAFAQRHDPDPTTLPIGSREANSHISTPTNSPSPIPPRPRAPPSSPILPRPRTYIPAPPPDPGSRLPDSSLYHEGKVRFFQQVWADLTERFEVPSEDILTGIVEVAVERTVPSNLPADLAATLPAMSRLAGRTGCTWVFGQDGRIELAGVWENVGQGADREDDPVEKYLSESELFEAENMRVQLKPMVRYQLPIRDERQPLVKMENESLD